MDRDVVFEYLQDGILVFDSEDNLVDLNLKAQKWIGIDKINCLHQHLSAVFRQYPQVVKTLLETPSNLFYQDWQIGKERKIFEIHTVPISEHESRFNGRIVLIRDVTSIYWTEDKLRASKRLLETLINATSSLIYIKSLDGRYILGNRSWAESLNLPIFQALGRTDTNLHPIELAIQLRANDLKVIQTGQPIEFEETVIGADGEERVYLSTKFPIHDASGRLYATAGISTDITQRIQTEQMLRLQSFALRATANAIVITDGTGSILWVNPAFTQLTGYTLEEVIGKNPRLLKSSKTAPQVYKELWETVLKGETWRGELVNVRKDGSEYIEEQTITPLMDERGVISHFIAIKQDITDRHLAEQALLDAHENLQNQYKQIQILQEKLREQAIRDPLTGLLNRRYLQETLPRELARARREQKPVSVIMFDIDHFKSVNDTYGHATGDMLLRALGELMRCLIRESDIACRYGGEEFVVVLPGASLKDGCNRAESFREGIEKLSIIHENQRLSRTISLGIAVYPEHGTDSETLLRAADKALYQAKEAGRNQVKVFSQEQ